ncbi:MAG TPA: MarR family transcriptional regulator [Rhizomicrobium sp.]|jgi:DNA-binding MarR family transcriptional regulator
MNRELRQLHTAFLDLAGMLNEPQRDDVLIAEAGISLDRALFPLLVRIERKGPIGIVELANISGRDHTTVSRQVAKLERLGLVTRQPGKADRRVREAAVTKKGLTMTKALDDARERIAGPIFAQWSKSDRQNLVRLLRKFIDAARSVT